MAQIIKHRRGSLEALSAVTSSLQKGELVIASGSSNLSVTNGASIVFAVPENGQVQAVNRFLVGNAAPNTFAAGTYNGLVKGVPYYASGSSTLYLLGEGANDIPDLTGNISNFSSSVSASISALSASIGGGSIGTSVAALNTFSGSTLISLGALNSSSASQQTQIDALSGFTGSYATTGSNVFIGDQTISGSITIRDEQSEFQIQGNGFGETYLQTTTGDLLLYATNGVNPATVNVKGGNLTVDGTISGSIVGIGNVTEFSTSVDSRLSNLQSKSASVDTSIAALNSYTSSNTSTTALNNFTASAAEKFIEIGVVSGSLISSASAAKSTNDTQDGRLSNLETTSASVNISVANINSFSSSQLTQNTALATVTGSLIGSASAAAIAIANLNTNSGSYATTGSNVFYGTQTITGSLYITNDLVVYGSSSLFNVTASVLQLGDNTIVLNTATPAIRFAGIDVIDSGSTQATGSLYWDSLRDHWVSVRPSSSTEIANSAVLIYGPMNTGSIGDETLLTTGKIMVSVGEDHIGDSIATQATDNSKITISGSLGVSGSIVVNNAIVGTGSIFLQPDITDSRKLEIYNTSVTDVHIKATGGQTFLGDDTNFVEINDSLQTITITGVNGVFINNSLEVTGPISSSAGFSGSIEGIGNVTAYSSSVSASLAAIVANVGSGVGVSIENLNSFSSSTLGRLTNIELFSSSVETKLIEIGVVSGSLFTSASAAKTTNDTQDGRLTNLESTSASVNTSVSNLNTTTASLNTSVSNLNSTTASLNTSVAALNTVSASNLGRLSNLESTSASVNISIEALNSYTSSNTSTTALNAFTASAGGRLDNLETTSASVNTSVSNLNSFSSSVLTQLIEIGVVSGSLFTSASTAKSTNDTQDGRLSNLETKSASVDISISNINSFTSSFGTTFSSSVDSRLDALEGTGTIQGVGTSNNVTFAKVTTTGDVVVGGDLVVQGNTVTLNTATLVVEDKLITLASGSTSSATADGAGFEVEGANANFVYQHSTTSFTSSVALIAPSVTASINLGSTAGSSKRVAFRNTNGNLDLVPTASVAGDLLQWDGNDFVMSNTIDGGSF
jgi:uncharacterized coiled-coil protein SlyX